MAPMFKHRHYKKLAEFWKQDHCLMCWEPVAFDILNSFINMLIADNPRFDEGKFRAAIGVDQSGRPIS